MTNTDFESRGRPLHELFRLEAISVDTQAVNDRFGGDAGRHRSAR
jgi:hypothetical protein